MRPPIFEGRLRRRPAYCSCEGRWPRDSATTQPPLVPPSVHREAILEGLRRRDPDARELQRLESEKGLIVVDVSLEPSARLHSLGAGEQESIRLAIERSAGLLLLDDWEARQIALTELSAAGSPTKIRGTLGVIVAAYASGVVTRATASELIERIRQRPDIWISDRLCERALAALARAPG